ncbi:hypothetical protein [Rubrivivax gelatinosus]|uniref:hypothetical protein n=1 Tax=Rubrivivax gelatinosus TaxID=28068 RepID=UPI0012FDE017|nr:hypothetical protein [Rubrivivax gelatinosus]MBG6083036.1 hypothetical protein [Rubrivivax gelatinosus]
MNATTNGTHSHTALGLPSLLVSDELLALDRQALRARAAAHARAVRIPALQRQPSSKEGGCAVTDATAL